MPINSDCRVQVSEIIDTVTDQTDGHGYLGFIITYPDGRIVNKILEYDQHNYQTILSQIEGIYIRTLRYHHKRD